MLSYDPFSFNKQFLHNVSHLGLSNKVCPQQSVIKLVRNEKEFVGEMSAQKVR